MKKITAFFLFLFVSIGLANAQTTKITGKVLSDEDNEPIIGASVIVKGTTTGTVTNYDGDFSLDVPSTAKTLQVSYVGMTTQDVHITERPLTIILKSSLALDEVVVTGLGIRKSEKSIGYSVSKVSSDELMKSGQTNVIDGLAGKASGVQITSSSGTPGASTKIVLRGIATFNGDNQPLIVIDGVPMSNAVDNYSAGDDPYNNTLAGAQTANRALDLNPDDIESVSILKGPAAAAIYGQAAGNGAIIYTTKKGSSMKGLGITYSSSLELSTVSQLPKIQKRYGQGSKGIYDRKTANSWGPDLIEAGTPVYDNMKEFFQTGESYVNNLSIVGGNDKTTFRTSINATNMGGVVPESKMDRYSLRLTADHKVSEWLNVAGSMTYTNTKGRMVQNGSNLSGVMLPLLRMPVEFDIRNYINEETGEQITYFDDYDNPLFSVKKNPYTDDTDRFLGNFSFDIKINPMFTLTSKTGVDAYSTEAKQIYALYSMGNDYNDGSGQVNRQKIAYRNLYSDLLLKFYKSFGENNEFTISSLLGANYNYTEQRRTFERGRGMVIQDFYGFSGYKELYVSDRDRYKESKAIFLDATFDYKSILFLTLTGRNEWSSTFGKGSGGFFYPKVDLSYVFSHWLTDHSILTYGKVRMAYANVGISPNYYEDRTYYEVPTVADGMTNGLGFPYLGYQPGFAISETISGFDLKPERNIGKEIGLEMRFLNGRIGFEGTFYEQTSKDLLLTQPIAPSSGFSYKYINIGQLQNRGVELTIDGDIFKTRDFVWNMSVNFSKNKNKVLKLAPGVNELPVGSGFVTPKSYAMVGEPFGVFYGRKYQRDEAGNLLINPANGLPIAESTEQRIGDPNRNWTMGINNSLTYKGINLSVLLDIRNGGDIWNGTWANLNFRGKSLESEDRTRNYVIDGVYASGPNKGQQNTKEIPATTYFGGNYLGDSGSENSIQSGSWFRVRSINLSYAFNFAKKNPDAVVRTLEIGTTLKNMFLFTNYKGVDPETSLTGAGQNLMGYDFFNNPGTKSVLFNLKIGF